MKHNKTVHEEWAWTEDEILSILAENVGADPEELNMHISCFPGLKTTITLTRNLDV